VIRVVPTATVASGARVEQLYPAHAQVCRGCGTGAEVQIEVSAPRIICGRPSKVRRSSLTPLCRACLRGHALPPPLRDPARALLATWRPPSIEAPPPTEPPRPGAPPTPPAGGVHACTPAAPPSETEEPTVNVNETEAPALSDAQTTARRKGGAANAARAAARQAAMRRVERADPGTCAIVEGEARCDRTGPGARSKAPVRLCALHRAFIAKRVQGGHLASVEALPTVREVMAEELAGPTGEAPAEVAPAAVVHANHHASLRTIAELLRVESPSEGAICERIEGILSGAYAVMGFDDRSHPRANVLPQLLKRRAEAIDLQAEEVAALETVLRELLYGDGPDDFRRLRRDFDSLAGAVRELHRRLTEGDGGEAAPAADSAELDEIEEVLLELLYEEGEDRQSAKADGDITALWGGPSGAIRELHRRLTEDARFESELTDGTAEEADRLREELEAIQAALGAGDCDDLIAEIALLKSRRLDLAPLSVPVLEGLHEHLTAARAWAAAADVARELARRQAQTAPAVGEAA
jgi:hypothetical protein